MRHPVHNPQFVQRYMYIDKLSKSKMLPLFIGFFWAVCCWGIGGVSYYQILQAEAEQKEIVLWRPVTVIYDLVGGEAVLVISLLLGIGSLYFGWRNYKIKNTSLIQGESVNDETGSYKVTVGDINALERQIGFSLPQDYRDFLLRYNGGSPLASLFNDNIEIDYFYNLVTDNRELQLSEIFERLPNYGLPIAVTFAGDLLILAPKGEIFFFDIEIFCDDEGEFLSDIDDEPECIAESFTALLEGLY
ncbi:SMI1/KNR4 family protein [Rodentibacter caecimuris]|uniref:Knr4/Smi1-like domain-containing protein n=1 Tax=Rodentibacter caecimuris TaxID=1796644 RepID=A0AAJ3N098_9PAST|nr:SMI1/KNR4 family protein [Rodentibacter heylii]AOF52334.1 hypothetical protein AC062_0234 [Pasteurellaceae bacterium NI1060]OOF70791.1 hypothetical protein BKG90_09280 [Rodentibacter heylii]OOF76957.1 hypothetical protein BKG99_04620 [Rodentibacter heylii]